jgi:hypothetical protein
MGLGRQTNRQSELLLSWDELPRSQGHPFYPTFPIWRQFYGQNATLEGMKQT